MPEKKIVVDEDWKTQVEREREAVLHPPEEPLPAKASTPPNPSPSDLQLPPPGLSYLANSLYAQALVSLGLVPHPVSNKAEVNLPLAKHAIDTLEILQQKTDGNRTPDESQEIEAMLYQLRMAFVRVKG